MWCSAIKVERNEKPDLRRQNLTEMAASGIATPRVIILAIYAFEGRGLIYWNRARAILVLLIGIVYGCTEGTETIRLARSERGVWLRSWQFIVSDETVILGCARHGY